MRLGKQNDGATMTRDSRWSKDESFWIDKDWWKETWQSCGRTNVIDICYTSIRFLGLLTVLRTYTQKKVK